MAGVRKEGGQTLYIVKQHDDSHIKSLGEGCRECDGWTRLKVYQAWCGWATLSTRALMTRVDWEPLTRYLAHHGMGETFPFLNALGIGILFELEEGCSEQMC